METVRWPDDREARAWSGLQMMQLRVDGELARRMEAATGLTYTDYVVLAALTARPGARLRLYELAEELGWEKSRLSHHLKRMVARRLVVKQPCEDDRRGAYVVVTATGRAAIEAAAPGHLIAVRELFVNHLTDEQLDVLGDVAQAVLGVFETSVAS